MSHIGPSVKLFQFVSTISPEYGYKRVQMASPREWASRGCLQRDGPNLHSYSAPKIFICYMMHESTLSSHTTLLDPWPFQHRCNMTWAATIHFGLSCRFNEFLLCCLCMSLALFLIPIAATVALKYITEIKTCSVQCEKNTFLVPSLCYISKYCNVFVYTRHNIFVFKKF